MCFGRKANAQTKQERQVGVGGWSDSCRVLPFVLSQHKMATPHKIDSCNNTGVLYVISRRQNGENKPLTVPKDIDLHLEKAPVGVIDALGKTAALLFTSL